MGNAGKKKKDRNKERILKEQLNEIGSSHKKLEEENIKLMSQCNELKEALSGKCKEIQCKKDEAIQQNAIQRRLENALESTRRKLSKLQREYNEYKKQNEKLNLTKYKEWTRKQFIAWIMSLDDGRFVEYKQIFQKVFKT